MTGGGTCEPTQGSSMEATDRKNSRETVSPSGSAVNNAPFASGKEEPKRREGFSYIEITIHSVKGVRFGLGIKHFNDQVIVSKSEKGSICGSQLKVLDHIVEVNGIPVTDKDICREMVIKSMQNDNMVNLVIERPVNEEAITSMKSFLEAACHPTANNSPVNHGAGAPRPDKPLVSNHTEMMTAKENRKVKTGEKIANEMNAEQRSHTLIPWPNRSVDAIEGHQERQRPSTKAKHGNVDQPTDRQKRATNAIVVKGRRDSRLIGVFFQKLGLKRKSEVRG
ncbi:hypothetical protein GCK32_004368 [Trichostrongylus colubriformis]|uniref:PDZ domain-containing protein n=1 Tax=Trichostrongylus colubriformis TaxID=6319 RepID=A0AAN8J2P8_TRICO